MRPGDRTAAVPRRRPAPPSAGCRRPGLACLLMAALAAPPGAADDALAAAERAWQQGDARAAIDRLQQRLSRAPHDLAAEDLLARVLVDDGHPGVAVGLLRRRQALGPLTPAAQATLAEALWADVQVEPVIGLTEQGPADAPADVRARLLTVRGQALLASDRPDQAAAAFAVAARLAPDSAGPLLGQAALARRRGDEAAALGLLEAASRAARDAGPAWAALGDLAYRAGDYARARDAYSQALLDARSTWSLRYRRALCALALGDDAGATRDLEALRAAVAGFPGADFLDGALRLRAGDAPGALARLEAFLVHYPESPDARWYAAQARYRLGRLAEAADDLLAVLAARPGDPAATLLLGRLRLDQGDHAGAVQVLRPLVAQADPPAAAVALLQQANQFAEGRAGSGADTPAAPLPSPAVLLEQARGRAEHAPAEAVRLLRAALADGTGTWSGQQEARLLLIGLLLRTGAVGEAATAADDYLARHPDEPRARAARALVWVAQGNPVAARLLLQEARQQAPGFAPVVLALAVLEFDAGRLQAAQTTLRDLHQQDPDNAAAVLLLAALTEAGGGDGWQDQVRAALAARPQNLALRAVLVRHELARRRPDQALALVYEAPVDLRGSPGLLLLEAEALAARGDPGAAADRLRQAADLAPQNAAVLFALARQAAAAGRPAQARAALLDGLRQAGADLLTSAEVLALLDALPEDADRDALLTAAQREAPRHPALLEAVAILADRRGSPAAVSSWQALVEVAPERARAQFGLAQALAVAGRSAEARARLSAWAADHPRDTAALLLRARLEREAGDPAAAMDSYRAVLGRDADHPVALNNLAVLTLVQHPRAALALAERALELQPQAPDVQDTLGLARLANGNRPGALDLLRRAAAASDNPLIGLHHALALLAAGDLRAAREALTPLLERDFPEQPAARALHTALATAPAAGLR